MKIVHILGGKGPVNAYCGHAIDFYDREKVLDGWCRFDFMSEYGFSHSDYVKDGKKYLGAKWQWCADCTKHPDYILKVLSEVGSSE